MEGGGGKVREAALCIVALCWEGVGFSSKLKVPGPKQVNLG